LLKDSLEKFSRKYEWRAVSGTERDALYANYSAWGNTSGSTKTIPSGSLNPVEAGTANETLAATNVGTVDDTMMSRVAVIDCMMSSAAIRTVSERSYSLHTPTLQESLGAPVGNAFLHLYHRYSKRLPTLRTLKMKRDSSVDVTKVTSTEEPVVVTLVQPRTLLLISIQLMQCCFHRSK